MLSAAELADLRATVEANLPDRCELLEPQRVSDGAGGYTESLVSVQANVPCAVASINEDPREQVVGGRITSVATHTATVPTATVVRSTMVLQHKGSDYHIVGGASEQTQELAKRLLIVGFGDLPAVEVTP